MLAVQIDGKGASVEAFCSGVELNFHLRSAVPLHDLLETFSTRSILVVEAYEANPSGIRLTVVSHQSPVRILKNKLVVCSPGQLNKYVRVRNRDRVLASLVFGNSDTKTYSTQFGRAASFAICCASLPVVVCCSSAGMQSRIVTCSAEEVDGRMFSIFCFS